MVPINLSKGGGFLLLSCCTRSCGGSVGRHSLFPRFCSTSYHYSTLKGKGLQKGNWNYEGVLKIGTLSLSHGASSLDREKITSAARIFCTASNVAESSALPTASPVTSPNGSENDEQDGQVDMNAIKEAANTLDIRVGRILKAWRHEEADSLYVEEVDIGEGEPRIICSGLVKYVPIEHLQDKNVVVLANLKARNMRGVKSCGMLMAASDASHENVELLEPPEGSLPGDRVWFGSEEEKESLPDAASPNQIQKKKIWEQVQPHLATDASGVAALDVHLMRTSTGAVVSKSLKNANIS